MITESRTADYTVLTRPADYEAYQNRLWSLVEKYPCLHLHTIGTTVGGHSLYAVSVGGEGDMPSVVYAGGFGGDWTSTAVLLRFLAEYARLLGEDGWLYRIHLPDLFAHRRICVCPAVNGDGLTGRTKSFCNRAGGDIAAFFAALAGDAQTEDPVEKCPEGTAFCQYLRYQSPALFCTLHGGEISSLCVPRQPAPRAATTGRLLSRMLGVEMSTAADPLASAAGWYGKESMHPSFAVTLTSGDDEDGILRAWAAVREMLYAAPLLA